MLSRCLVEIFVDGRFPFVRRDVMLQVAIGPPEGEHAPEYKLVQREEASQLRRRSRVFLLAQSAEYDEGHPRRPQDLKLRADLTQNDTISPCRVLDQVASMGFQLFACPECEYQNVYVFVRRDGGL